MNAQTNSEAVENIMKLADDYAYWLEAKGHVAHPAVTETRTTLLAAVEELAKENEELRKAYLKMRNSAAGYSNYCDDSASVRRCERDYEEAESMFRAIDAAMKGQS